MLLRLSLLLPFGCVVEREERDRISPGAVVVAAGDTDALGREDERRVACLKHSRLCGEVGHAAPPRLCRPARDLACAARLARRGVHQESLALEQGGDCLAIADDKCVLEQGVELLRCSRSRSHGCRRYARRGGAPIPEMWWFLSLALVVASMHGELRKGPRTRPDRRARRPGSRPRHLLAGSHRRDGSCSAPLLDAVLVHARPRLAACYEPLPR